MTHTNRNRENFILQVMNKGFDRAAQAFSKFIDVPVRKTQTRFVMIRQDEPFTFLYDASNDIRLLTTQIIGEFAGKSYLIFDREECEEVFRAVSKSKTGLSESLKDPLLLEIDNIISASVIAELANALNAEIYGDVPAIHTLSASRLQELIRNDIEHTQTSSVIFTQTTFTFGDHQHISPQFVWKLSSQVFDLVPAEKAL
jgi:chemotaxis protein CheY-P-specific phosphatase CheC